MTGRTPRPVAVVRRELREVERHLVDAPPHSAAGVRADLQRRRDALQRELAAGRRASSSRGGGDARAG